MLSRFQTGTIVSLEAMEDIINTSICVVDKQTGKVRMAKDMDEFLTHQVVLVSNITDRRCCLPAGCMCRCWYVYLVV